MGSPNLRAIYEKRVREHDLTYEYSDDRYSYRRGSESLSQLRTLAQAINDPEYTKRIWNENVDQRLGEGFRESFYWR